MGSLNTGRQFVDTLTIVKMVYDIDGKVYILGFSLCLLPDCVEVSENIVTHLLWLA